jgi:hypothetical protein
MSTRPWSQAAIRRYAAPTHPGRILNDRRPPVPVNFRGNGRTTTYDKLTPAERRRFDAQYAAWRAACDLIRAAEANTWLGVTVPYEPIWAWYTARREWRNYR